MNSVHEQEQRHVAGVLDGATGIGGRNRQPHEQQRGGDQDKTKRRGVGGTHAQYTSRMNIRLSAIEARIIGSLIEKQITTPDQYPLSLNALVNACNQKSNREPLMQLDEATVKFVVDSLARRHLVVEKSGFGSRVPKYQQIFCNTEFGSLKFTPQETAIVCELLLRGPQTPGELRSRVTRMAELPDPTSSKPCSRHSRNVPTDAHRRAAAARIRAARFALGAAIRRTARRRRGDERRRDVARAARGRGGAARADLAARVAALEE